MEGKKKEFPQLKIYTQAEIEAYNGSYDKDGFYILPDGDFFDQQGYYFDKEGYDENGGFYDDDNGEYVSPPDDEEFADYYDELCGSDEDEEEENPEEEEDSDEEIYSYVEDGNQKQASYDYAIDESTASKGIRREHCIPALEWLKQQPQDKKHIIKIANVPRRATQEMLLKML